MLQIVAELRYAIFSAECFPLIVGNDVFQEQGLLIQRDHHVAQTRSTVLNRAGYVVREATSTEEARRLCATSMFDLVVVDSDRDYRAAVDLCEDLKKVDLSTMVAIDGIVQPLIRSSCPDDIIQA